MSTVAVEAPQPRSRKPKKVAAVAPVASVKQTRPLADAMKHLSDGSRLAILFALLDQPRNVGQLVADIGVNSQPAISHHLALLRAAGIVVSERHGKEIHYSLTPKGRKATTLVRELDAN